MSLKQEIETWVAALAAYDNNEFDEALKCFDGISDTSKILFNMGVIHATLGEHERAVECYQRAVRLDQYLAVAYFQQGVSNFLMGDFEEALANFNDTLLYLRGNNNIDYEQLGLKFKLYSCEVLFNRGLCYIYLQQRDAGMQDLSFAAKEKVVPDHDVIDEAIREDAEGYTVFSIPVGIVYRPNEAKVKNLKAKDYLGKARLVAASDRANAFTGFAGAEIKRINQESASGMNSKDDRPDDKISYAATNLVKPGLTSRSRQQSEPPINRNMFPPTPPPEETKGSPNGYTSRSQSVRGEGRKPAPLELGRAAFDQSPKSQQPRPMPQRSMSERPRPTRESSTSSSSRGPRNGGPSLRPRITSDEDDASAYPEDLYDMYGRSGNERPSYGGRSQSTRRPQQRPMYIEEEEEDAFDQSDIDSGEFEMVPTRSRSTRRPSTNRPRGQSQRRSVGLRTIRVKVHADDTRYVFLDPYARFDQFVGQIRDKFGLRANFKIKIKDEQDFITMSDQDDLDMAIMTCKQEAKREKAEMGKMEIWVQTV
ncbi:Phox/Bem1p [Lasiodiplodia theobromae]|uniref:Neutrophil cytosol factor 2 n=2 Tax=Lasiodiplodia TaxID=66739 RepID=A0A5N5DTM3_9PEZI|nr:NADPh oxidase [Lasiodiplodia theobromae]KAB2580302.1 Neutrophil cytosol factor 2 [Lasiodiplodia theobromae]KAF4546727.1 NADPh oxidase [Lasiodiplodia theobromae]KAF9632134.1 Phox/Bem1p [Lasiodiplodia theobromae]KAK0663673.1 Neutrophil cytosol factor 2 [Lasiodiplodia hormozganensis]